MAVSLIAALILSLRLERDLRTQHYAAEFSMAGL